ncbi:iron-sulfur cluster assembly 2 homolog, mitochondrial [Eurosta solidaginis]|uniref:iron-sulfur cluster assembly 2 homolog, mitochondrial n=1 Tax=Eurosta solidaginis TaxID=178769 RepID=UPI0035306D9C
MAFALRAFLQRQLPVIPRCSASICRQHFATNANDSSIVAATASADLKLNTIEPKLIVSDSCVKRLREICDGGRSFLRITVEGGGCSGFQYKFDLDTKLNQDDVIFGEEDAKVVIDNISLEYCAGATIDYHTELIRAGFRMLANPQAEQGCSCGASFSIKLD